MAFARDVALIERIVAKGDPSFATVGAGALESAMRALRDAGRGRDKDAFLFAAMRLLALPGNGHTRLIPNDAVDVLPLRFVALGDAVYLTAAPPGLGRWLDRRLVAVNGAPVEAVREAFQPCLAGTAQRRRAVGALLLAWPAALAHAGAGSRDGGVVYAFADDRGRVSTASCADAPTARASSIYPVSEHGRLPADGGVATFLECREVGRGRLLLRLPDFFDPTGRRLGPAIRRAAAEIADRPAFDLIVDVRGNPGGDFTATLPLLDALACGWRGERCFALVDKFTFSAALVFVLLLRHRLGRRVALVGEAMGDGTRFHAEGGTLRLPQSGAAVRWSSGLHDWETGVAGATTPPEVARWLVAAGPVTIDHAVAPSARALRAGEDPGLALAAALGR
jgi:hypothetical protein